MIRKPVKEPSSLAKSLPQTILDDYRVGGGEALGEYLFDHVLSKAVQRIVNSCCFRSWLHSHWHQFSYSQCHNYYSQEGLGQE